MIFNAQGNKTNLITHEILWMSQFPHEEEKKGKKEENMGANIGFKL